MTAAVASPVAGVLEELAGVLSTLVWRKLWDDAALAQPVTWTGFGGEELLPRVNL